MAFRLYIVPIVGTGTKSDPRAPKYLLDGTLTAGVAFSAVDYGIEPWVVLGADLSGADDTALTGKADVMALPFDLTPTLTAGQVTTVQNKLEAINVPAGWVSTSLTWTQVVRVVLGMFSFMQRFTAIQSNVSIFGSGVTLETTIGALSQNTRDNLSLAATSLGLSTSAITGTTTIRQALKILADQFGNRPYVIGGRAV